MISEHKTILVVDDESRIRTLVKAALGARGYSILEAGSTEQALEVVDGEVDLVITDLRMPGRDGLDLVGTLRERGMDMPVIVMTAHATVSTAVEAMRRGAFDYVTKPFDLDELEILVGRALAANAMAREYRYLRESGSEQLESMIGRSELMRSMFDQIRQVAASDASVMITGDTGTGKELAAKALHSLSPRAERLFVPVNCAAIPHDLLESELFGHSKGAFTGASADRVGKFELADGGTLFLDEIGDMDAALQAKILRVLEEGILQRVGSNRDVKIDTRVVSATHRNLEESIAAGKFRSDLFYRLNVIELRMPSLRDRNDDVPLLAEHFLESAAVRIGKKPLIIDEDGMGLLRAYDWPGNVRELRNVCERLTVLCNSQQVSADTVAQLVDISPGESGNDSPRTAADDGPLEGETPGTLRDAVDAAEAAAIRAALNATGDNKSRAARILDVSERSLWYKIKKHAARLGTDDETASA